MRVEQRLAPKDQLALTGPIGPTPGNVYGGMKRSMAAMFSRLIGFTVIALVCIIVGAAVGVAIGDTVVEGLGISAVVALTSFALAYATDWMMRRRS